jgi:hypothetical protein
MVATAPRASGTEVFATGIALGTATISASLDGMSGSTQVVVADPGQNKSPNSASTGASASAPMTAPMPAATTTPAPATRAFVTVSNVHLAKNRKQMVTGLTLDLNGPVDASAAGQMGMYRLTMSGSAGSSAARHARVIKLKSAVFNAALDQVTLIAQRAVPLSKPIQLAILGQQTSGKQDPGSGVIHVTLTTGDR